MKLILENWRKHLNEISSPDQEHMAAFKKVIADSQFWTLSNKWADVDEMENGDTLSTPAIESLMELLNQKAEELGSEIYFYLSVESNIEYAMDPESPYPGYPDNWLMQGQYQGPQKGKHVVWLQFRPLSDNYEMEEFNPAALIQTISQTLNHEMVHYEQLKKQAASKGLSDEDAWEELENDPKQIAPEDAPHSDYISLHNEIDAYAHEAAEELIDKYGAEEALKVIQNLSADTLDDYPEVSRVIADYMELFKEDPETLNKFRKKLYQQIEKQSGIREIFNNWRGYLNEMIELDIEVGDIILGGKYKNKRVEVKEIGKDELGQPTINGKSILKFRIEKHLPDEKKSKKTLEAEREDEAES